MQKEKNDQQLRILEVIAVVATGLGKFVFMDWLEWRILYISAAVIFWTSYIYYQRRHSPAHYAAWRLNTLGFRRTFLALLPFALLLSVAALLLGRQLGTSVLDWTILPILLLYPLWGIIQQFIMIGIFGNALYSIEKPQLAPLVIALIVAVVFAVVHFPSLVLVAATFFLALAYELLYLRGHNLIAMGIYHGWLGAVFFYTILGRHVWGEVFGGG